jgi:riboflavin kinase/FMN adenylyltransferase
LKIFRKIEDVKGLKNPVITIGTFDGVHLGHRAVFDVMKQEAKKINGETAVITFHPHPRIVLGTQDHKELKFINTQERKIKLIEKAGIDNLIIIEFTKEFAKNPSEVFIKDFVARYVAPKMIIVGHDHHFGRNRHGSYELLVKTGKELGFSVKRVEPLIIDGITVSSTVIRNLLKNGKIKEANRFLGYEYSITGEVVHGNGIGKTIGYPTANIKVGNEYKLITANGVYACRVEYGNKIYGGMGNIGYRPTIDDDKFTIEVNIFDFDKDIYGEFITIYFVDRLRDEVKFDSLDSLKKQLKKDKETAAALLKQPASSF